MNWPLDLQVMNNVLVSPILPVSFRGWAMFQSLLSHMHTYRHTPFANDHVAFILPQLPA